MKKFIFILCGLVAVFATLLIFGSHEAIGSTIALSPLVAGMSKEELQQFAEQALTDNYGGDDDYENFADLDDEDMYDGFDDPIVGFQGGAKSFLDEEHAGIYLTYSVVNNSGYSKTICINPAYFDVTGVTCVGGKGASMTDVVINHTNIAEITAAGHTEIHAVIADGLVYGTSGAGITFTALNGRINDHLRYVAKNPTRIPKMILMSVNNTSGAVDTTMYSKIMTIRRVNPYQRPLETIIDLNDFFKVEQYQSGKITIDTAKYGMQADPSTLIFFEIDNNIRLTIKMLVGGSADVSRTLHKKAKLAKRNIAQGTAGVVPAAARKDMKMKQNKRMNLISKKVFKGA